MEIGIVGPSFNYGGANAMAAIMGKEFEKNNAVTYFSFEDNLNFLEINENNWVKLYKPRNYLYNLIQKGRKFLEYFVNNRQFTQSRYVNHEYSQMKKYIMHSKIDIIVLNSFISSVKFAKKLKKDFPNIKIITWLHEDPYYAEEVTKNYRKDFIDSLRISDSIICLSKKSVEYYSQFNKNTQLIYNPVTIEIDKKSSLTNKIVSFTSRLDFEVKGLDLLIEVAKSLPKGWAIEFAGQGSDHEEMTLKKKIKENNVTDRLIFVGPLFGDDLVRHYVKSSLFLSTSRVEALPLVIIEAMEAGLPIVSFSHSGAIELLDNGKFGILIDNYKVEDMINAIKKLAENPQLRINYQNESLERVQDFELSSVIAQWNKLFSRLRKEV